jgi:hypothetical protein
MKVMGYELEGSGKVEHLLQFGEGVSGVGV